MDQLKRSGKWQYRARVSADRGRGGERQHRPHALATGEQRVAHRLLKPGGAGLVGKA
jgi:hypothetical protein